MLPNILYYSPTNNKSKYKPNNSSHQYRMHIPNKIYKLFFLLLIQFKQIQNNLQRQYLMEGQNVKQNFEFNLPQPIRIKEYIPISQQIDYAHPNYLYEGNKYKKYSQTAGILLDQQIAATLYGYCFQESLKTSNKQQMVDCYKKKLAIFRDIIQVIDSSAMKQKQ